MTGPGHYRRAEELTEKAHKYLGQGDGQESAAVWAAVAQIHATLALAAANAVGTTAAEGRAWPTSLAPSSRQAVPRLQPPYRLLIHERERSSGACPSARLALIAVRCNSMIGSCTLHEYSSNFWQR
jgi:hypothetical protein